MPEALTVSNVGIWSRSKDIEVSEIEEILEVFKEFSPPDVMDNQVINIKDEADEDFDRSAIIYADDLPSSSRPTHVSFGEINLLAASVYDGEIRISADVESNLIDSLTSLYDEILDVRDLHVVDFTARYDIGIAFSELGINIEGPSNYEFQGTSFQKDGFNYEVRSEWARQFSELDIEGEGSELDKEETCSVMVESINHFDVQDSAQFIEDSLENIEGALGELIHD